MAMHLRFPRLFPLAVLGAGVFLARPPAIPGAHAQTAPRLFLVPALGVAREASRPSFDTPAFDAWTVGAQLEYATASRWIPLVAAHRWSFDRMCEGTPTCGETGWSAEAGVTRSLVPTGTIRPYAGAVAGVHHVDRGVPFVQGRAGVDLVPRRSPFAVRVEARFHRPMEQRTAIGQFFMLHTGLRLALPGGR